MEDGDPREFGDPGGAQRPHRDLRLWHGLVVTAFALPFALIAISLAIWALGIAAGSR